MIYWLGASLVLSIHFLFIIFVLLGGLLVIRWPKLAWLHLPAITWGALVEFNGWICPLTPLENDLRKAGGLEGYSGGFIEHYIYPLIYIDGLTRDIQIIMGIIVIILNILIYGILLYYKKRNV